MKTSKEFVVRRHFTDAQRQAIVDEARKPGMTVGAVARAHKLSPPTIFNWIRRCKLGKNEIVPSTGTMPTTYSDISGCGNPTHNRIQNLEEENSQLKIQIFKLKAFVGGKLFEMENLR